MWNETYNVVAEKLLTSFQKNGPQSEKFLKCLPFIGY